MSAGNLDGVGNTLLAICLSLVGMGTVSHSLSSGFEADFETLESSANMCSRSKSMNEEEVSRGRVSGIDIMNSERDFDQDVLTREHWQGCTIEKLLATSETFSDWQTYLQTQFDDTTLAFHITEQFLCPLCIVIILKSSSETVRPLLDKSGDVRYKDL